jgi:uncharacterized protein YcaQ
MNTTVDSLIAQITPEHSEQYIPTRYPYTYACDFIRQHPYVVPVQVRNDMVCRFDASLMSRSDASQVCRVWAEVEGRDSEDLARILADAYLHIHRVEKPA